MTIFVVFFVDIADAATSSSAGIIPDGNAEHLVFAVALAAGFVAAPPEIGAADFPDCGEGGFDEVGGDFGGGTGASDFIDDEDVFAIEGGGRGHNAIDIFVVDTSLYIEGAEAGEIAGVEIFDVEIGGGGGAT